MKRILFIALIFLASTINGSSFHKPTTHFNRNNIKFVSYAFNDGDRIEIHTVAAKQNLGFEPYQNWLAKAVYDGDNYNTTGYKIKKP